MAERKQFTCNSFVFYGSFYEAISVLPAENQAHIYDAIFKFAFENIEVDLDGVELAVFLLIKPQLIANRARYENGCKGGRPRKDETETQPNEKQTESGNVDNQNQNKTEQKPKQNLTETKAKPNDNDNYNYLLAKDIKEKITNACMYAQGTGRFDRPIELIIKAMTFACQNEKAEIYADKQRNSEYWISVLEDRSLPNILAKTVNSLMTHDSEIRDEIRYTLSVIASESDALKES